MKKAPFHYLIAVSVILLQSCAIIRPGEVGLAVHRGKIKPGILMPGAHGKSIFGTKIARFDSRTKEYSSELSFHSKEGIEVTSETTMLYHFIPDSLPSIYLKFGQDYEKIVIINSLITALRREGLNHIATDLIIERTSFEKSIQDKLNAALGKYGFVIDLILLKDIELPANVVQTIQSKLNAEQLSKKTEIDLDIKRKELDYTIEKEKKEAEFEITKQKLTLDFAIEKQRKENERLLLESEGISKSQSILNASITDKLLQYKALDITRELVKSPNAKIIITDGKSPWIINDK